MKTLGRLTATVAIALAGHHLANAQEQGPQLVPTVDCPLPRPAMGWTTYNYFGARHNHELLSATADAFIASGLKDAGYTFLRIDGGWWGEDGNKRHYYWTESGTYQGGAPYGFGDPHVDPKQYPRGLKGLADDLHAKGMKLGFYLSPSLSIGEATNHPGNRPETVASPVTGKDLILQHARFVAESGIDHLFFDGYDWSRERGIAPYEWMSDALREHAHRSGRPIVFSINSGSRLRPVSWADEWRTSGDINGQWKTVLECLSSVADPAQAGNGRWNNPDCLMAGFESDVEAQSQMSLWCVAGAPLYLSGDHRVMNEWERYVLLNGEAIAVDQDPAGRCGRRVRMEASIQVWAREMKDGSSAVVLLNAGEKPLDIPITWHELSLPTGPARIRDLWEHRMLGVFTDRFTAVALPPHGCRFLRIYPGEAQRAEPRNTWAPHPALRKDVAPLSSKGWIWKSNLDHFNVENVTDGNPKTGIWSNLKPGSYFEIDFGLPMRVDRLVVDSRGVGPNPWPYRVYAPRTTVNIEGSEDGTQFRSLSQATLGPLYLRADFAPATILKLRVIIQHCDRTTAYHDPTWDIRDIYLFDSNR